MRFWKLLGRGLWLRCPLCGQGRLFRGLLRMHENCPCCGVHFEREPGFFLGSIYINYGLTALILAIGYPALLLTRAVPTARLQMIALAFALLFPVLVFRHARSLWLGFDQWHDPRPGEST